MRFKVDASGFPGHVSLSIGFDETNFDPSSILEELSEFEPFVDGIIVTDAFTGDLLHGSDLFRMLKSRGLFVKLETDGLRPGYIGKLAYEGLVDLFSIDVLAAPGYGEKVDEFIGRQIPEYFELLSESLNYAKSADLELVYPIVPGFNDSRDEIARVSEFASDYGARLVLSSPDKFDVDSSPSLYDLYSLANYSVAETWIKTRRSGYDIVKPGF